MVSDWTFVDMYIIGVFCFICLCVGGLFGYLIGKTSYTGRHPETVKESEEPLCYTVVMTRAGKVLQVARDPNDSQSGDYCLTDDRNHGSCMIAHVSSGNIDSAVRVANAKRSNLIEAGEWAV